MPLPENSYLSSCFSHTCLLPFPSFFYTPSLKFTHELYILCHNTGSSVLVHVNMWMNSGKLSHTFMSIFVKIWISNKTYYQLVQNWNTDICTIDNYFAIWLFVFMTSEQHSDRRRNRYANFSSPCEKSYQPIHLSFITRKLRYRSIAAESSTLVINGPP